MRPFTRRQLLAAPALLAADAKEKQRPPSPKRLIGVTMMPEFIQNEGIDGVLRNLVERAGVNAITTSPYVMEPASEKTGSREPPIDADAGKVRLLDRPLWGKRELWVRTAPSFAHDFKLFPDFRYQPTAASELTRAQGGVIRDFIREAQRRKVKVFFQVQAAIPPGYRVQFGGPKPEDAPRLPDGRIPPRRLANNGSLGSIEVRQYLSSLIRDIFRVYPEIDGLRLDWPEYPPYFLDDLFLDFSDHAAAAASRARLLFKDAKQSATEWYARLHGGLTNTNVEKEIAAFAKLRGGDWRRLKQAMAGTLLEEAREAVDEAGGRDKELIPNAFPPPFNDWSGLTPPVARATGCNGMSVKFYTMHWPMMLRFYAEALLKANRGLDERKLVPALARWLSLTDDDRFQSLADCRYPEPDEAHPVGRRAIAGKFRAVRMNSPGFTVYGLAHGYGPVDDFAGRLRVVHEASEGKLWINRYGYLSDAKLERIKAICA
jgi:hypothetical protein